MIAEALTVYMLGVRHGADPDHLAAIDNLTRSSRQRQPVLSRFVGTLFAGGHSVMVLCIAALVGLLGTRFVAYGDRLETIGTIVSIVVLVAIGLVNLQQLRAGNAPGLRTKLLPRRLRAATSALAAIPVGLLFGLGFETSSQVATYAVAFSARSGVLGALAIGCAFCIGMITSDTLDSVLIYRLVSRRGTTMSPDMRVWIWATTVVAFIVAAYEVLPLIGVPVSIPELAVSGAICGSLGLVFLYVFLRTTRQREFPSKGEIII